MHRPAQTKRNIRLPSVKSRIRRTSLLTLERLNPPPGETSWFHPFAYKRFHVLLNSLFKVLCNFPSRYLFAIGIAVVFSLRWSLPPALGCTLKQPDSIMTQLAKALDVRYGPSTHFGKKSLSGELAAPRNSRLALRHTRGTGCTPFDGSPSRWAPPCSLAATEGIPFGFFSSA